jgi:hypothetical protein
MSCSGVFGADRNQDTKASFEVTQQNINLSPQTGNYLLINSRPPRRERLSGRDGASHRSKLHSKIVTYSLRREMIFLLTRVPPDGKGFRVEIELGRSNLINNNKRLE